MLRVFLYILVLYDATTATVFAGLCIEACSSIAGVRQWSCMCPRKGLDEKFPKPQHLFGFVCPPSFLDKTCSEFRPEVFFHFKNFLEPVLLLPRTLFFAVSHRENTSNNTLRHTTHHNTPTRTRTPRTTVVILLYSYRKYYTSTTALSNKSVKPSPLAVIQPTYTEHTGR